MSQLILAKHFIPHIPSSNHDFVAKSIKMIGLWQILQEIHLIHPHAKHQFTKKKKHGKALFSYS